MDIGDAQFEMGRRLIATDRDAQAAFRWFSRAAEQGLPKAQYCVGVCHLKGRGVAQNNVEAYRCFLRAGHAGHPRAEAALRKLERQLDPATLAQARDSDGRFTL